MSDIPQIIGGVSLLVGTVFTGWAAVDNRRQKRDADSAEDYANLQRWYPRALRAFTLLTAMLGRAGVAVPAEVDELIEFPPPRAKHARGVSSDAE